MSAAPTLLRIALVWAGAWSARAATLLPGPVEEAAARERGAAETAALEARVRFEQQPPDSILLVSSSSIRLWDTAAADLASWYPIPRGLGGARFSAVAVLARRLITPHQFRALVLCMANDVTSSPADATRSRWPAGSATSSR